MHRTAAMSESTVGSLPRCLTPTGLRTTRSASTDGYARTSLCRTRLARRRPDLSVSAARWERPGVRRRGKQVALRGPANHGSSAGRSEGGQGIRTVKVGKVFGCPDAGPHRNVTTRSFTQGA